MMYDARWLDRVEQRGISDSALNIDLNAPHQSALPDSWYQARPGAIIAW